MDYEDADQLGEGSSLGLHSILRSAGIDPSTANVFSGGDGAFGQALGEVEVEDPDARYMDDVSDEETAEEREQRERDARRQAAIEARYLRRGMEMRQEAMERTAKKGRNRTVETEEDKRSRVEKYVKDVWPDWQPGGRIRMSEVFFETPRMVDERWEETAGGKRRKMNSEGITEFRLNIQKDISIPATQAFLMPNLRPLPTTDPDQPAYASALSRNFEKNWIKEARALRRKALCAPPVGLLPPEAGYEDNLWAPAAGHRPLDLIDWEKDIIFNPLAEPAPPLPEPLKPRNAHLSSGDWLNEIIWDTTRLTPDLLLDEEEEVPPSKPPLPPVAPGVDRFNISNDHLYEQNRESKYRIRQTFGAIEVFHSAPAKALQMPFYKTSLSKAESRAWKRPAIQFPIGIKLGFSKLRINPTAASHSRKKAMMSDPSERFKSTRDLSLAEKGPYVLLEFSEEYPPIMSGYGMGTTIVNYYRKKDDKDEHVPKLDLGQPSILNVGDGEPYLLGYVDKGQVTQVIHNNLIRAPIYKHTPETTDFLVIRHTVNGHATYHIRPITNLFTVGQTVPNESEVPGPHARKNTTYAKVRLQIVAWLLINKSKQKRIKMGKLLKYFPDQTELQMRQRLKIKGQEFLIYNRSQGPNQGYWALNPGYPGPWPTERQEVLEQATPESAMLYESMQVGARHLYDAGYTKTAEGKDDDDGDESNLDVEQKLAVWSTTLNYKKAEQGKAWIIVHGDGDPTGRGEGWSFLTRNMKERFLRKGEVEEPKEEGSARTKVSNAEQNRIYEEEKRRIWDLQADALSDPTPPELAPGEDDQNQASTGATPSGFGPRFSRADSRRAFSRGNSMANTPAPFTPYGGGAGYEESPREYSPAPSADGSAITGPHGQPKVMRIQRRAKGKLQVEIVRDPAVIAAYRRRVEDRKIEEFRTQADKLVPTGNAEEDELRRAALMQELENIKKNQARRMARKKYTQQATYGIRAEDYDPELDAGKRKCSACGQIGHTKANRNCPMYNQPGGGGDPRGTAGLMGQSPMAATPVGMTPGGWSQGAQTPMDYFGQGQGATPTDGGVTPSLKIRLGTGGGR